MDKELLALLQDARMNGANASQLDGIISAYNSKKKSGGISSLASSAGQLATTTEASSISSVGQSVGSVPSISQSQEDDNLAPSPAVKSNIKYGNPFEIPSAIITTKDGTPFPIANIGSYGLDENSIKGLQARVNDNTATAYDVDLLARVTNKTPKTIAAYVAKNKYAGNVSEFDDLKTKQGDQITSLIQKANSELGLSAEPNKIMSSAESLSDYISDLERRYTDKAKSDARVAKSEMLDENFPSRGTAIAAEKISALTAKSTMGVFSEIKNSVSDLIKEKISLDPNLKGDEKLKKIIALTGKREQDQRDEAIKDREGSGIFNRASLFSPILGVIKSFSDDGDLQKDREILNADKAFAERKISQSIGERLFYNDAKKNNLLAELQSKSTNISEEERSKYENEIKAIDVESNSLKADFKSRKELYKSYPVLLKAEVVNEVNNFNARRSDNVKGGDSDYQSDVSLEQHLSANGFDIKDRVVKDVIEEANKTFLSNPLTYTFGEHNLKDYTLFGRAATDFGGVFTSVVKSAGDITGVRDDVDVLRDKKREEMFPSQIGEKDEYQLTGAAKIVQNIAGTTSQVLGQGLLQVGTMGIGRIAGLSKVAAANSAFWSSGALTSYDAAYKDSYDFIDTGLGRTTYAGLMALFTATTEKFFPEAKILQGSGVKDAISKFAITAGRNELTENATKELLGGTIKNSIKNLIFDKALKFGKAYTENTAKEVAEEVSTSLFESGMRFLYGDPNIDMAKAIDRAKETAIQTATGMALIGGVGAYKDLSKERNLSSRSIIYNAALYKDEAMDAITKGYEEGLYSEVEKNQKVQTLNSAVAALGVASQIQKINGVELTRPNEEIYVANLTAEGLLKKELDQLPDSEKDENGVASSIKEKISNLQSQRKQILNDEVVVDDFGNASLVTAKAEDNVTNKENNAPEVSGNNLDSSVSGTQSNISPTATEAGQENKTEGNVEGIESTVTLPEDQITVGEMLDKTGTYKGKKGSFIQDGQTVVFREEGEKKEYELGNINEVGQSPISDYEIENEESVVTANETGNHVVRGKEYVNNYSDPLQAINRDEDGNVVSVSLENTDGKKVTFRNNIAEDLAYQINLKEINKDNGTREEFERFVESDEEAVDQINDGANTEAASQDAVATDESIPETETVREKIVNKNDIPLRDAGEVQKLLNQAVGRSVDLESRAAVKRLKKEHSVLDEVAACLIKS